MSFIVPVRNDAARLEVCLRSILRNAGTPGEIEIVVVDNGSSDRSPEVAKELGASVIVIENGSVSELRNRGARHATADVLAFIDADHEIVSTWVAAILDNLREPVIGAVGALCLSPPKGTWVQRTYGFLRGRPTIRQDVLWLGSGNLAVRRSTFEQLGGFDTSLEVCEDVDLCHRLRALGLRIVSDPRTENIHFGDPLTLRSLFVSELWRGADNLRVSFRRPIAWNALPSAVIPVVDALMLAALLGGLISFWAGWQPGLRLAALALAIVVLGASLKVAKATRAHRGVTLISLLQALVVGGVYDVARALSLFTKVSHRSERTRAPATAS